MKRVWTAFVICFGTWFWVAAHAPGRDLASIDLGKGKITIDYGTPNLNGRNLDEMIKPGVPWRMGMNEATILETSVALTFGGKTLPVGRYTIFARPDENKNWVLLICSSLTPRFDPGSVVLEAPLQFATEKSSIDVLKIALKKSGKGAEFNVAWGTYRLQTNLSAAAA
ncbi:MAG: DUF2911 domain-containing protein [Acidobacteria bacterium]|nr:DUF2911 domain-containing protein [Acidobacteriota bacterium]